MTGPAAGLPFAARTRAPARLGRLPGRFQTTCQPLKGMQTAGTLQFFYLKEKKKKNIQPHKEQNQQLKRNSGSLCLLSVHYGGSHVPSWPWGPSSVHGSHVPGRIGEQTQCLRLLLAAVRMHTAPPLPTPTQAAAAVAEGTDVSLILSAPPSPGSCPVPLLGGPQPSVGAGLCFRACVQFLASLACGPRGGVGLLSHPWQDLCGPCCRLGRQVLKVPSRAGCSRWVVLRVPIFLILWHGVGL